MSILKVARMGHPVLRTRAQSLDPSEIGDPMLQRLIDDLFDTMGEYQGIGLAAPQVHQSLRLFVAGVDDPKEKLPPVVMINPEIERVGSTTEEDWEGCLSVPDLRGRVPRATDIRINALDRHGQVLSMTASGFPARVIQHETDHLDGLLFLDRMTSLESLTFLNEYARYWEPEEEPVSKE
jgi:peptide deformylase